MNYKYYIYRQKVGATGDDKYLLSSYDLIGEVIPGGQWSLRYSQETNNKYVIRRKFNGTLVFKGDDYDMIKALENTPQQLAIVIKIECERLWVEHWKGYFSKYDWYVDENRCLLSFTPEVWDKYNKLYDIMDLEVNVLACDPYDVNMRRWPYAVESIYRSGGDYWVAFLTTPYIYEEYPDPAYAGSKYFLTYIQRGTDPLYFAFKFDREYRFSDDPITPPDPSWVLDPLLTPAGYVSPGVYKYVRPLGNYVYTVFVEDTVGNVTTWKLQGIIGAFAGEVTWYRCRKLNEVLEYYCMLAGLTYQSEFFQNDPHPMGGESLQYTMIQQSSEARSTADSEGAITANLKLKDLLKWINDTFNCYWYCNEDGELIIENEEWFIGGGAYGGIKLVELDFTVSYPEWISNKLKYKFNKPKVYKYEKWSIPESFTVDWLEGTIEYSTTSIMIDDAKETDIIWMTELQNVYSIREEIGAESWILLDTQYDGADYNVVATIGVLSNTLYHNARFATANLLDEFFRDGRIMYDGYINGVPVTFDSIQRLKIGDEFSFPLCCEDVDFEGLFKTDIGEGLLSEGEYESKSGMMKLILEYE